MESKTGLELIQEERTRQITKEGFDASHDSLHKNRELAQAGLCYWGYGSAWSDEDIRDMWPWEAKWWKPKDRISNLVRAGALFLAQDELDGKEDVMVRMISRKIDQVTAEQKRKKQTQNARFIATSTALLKWLLEINTTEQQVTFYFTEKTISCRFIGREFAANEMIGYGDFTYSKEQVELLISILKPIPEEPLTIVFDSWIWIQQIMI
jgi:hypothetical protein